MTVAVVTDSTCDIPPDVAKELGITIVPLYVQFGRESYRDNVDLTRGEFYDKLVHDVDYPKTATPNINDFLTIYNELATKTNEIICILLSSKLSGTYNIGVAAAKEVEADCHIEVIDSQTSVMGLGLLVIEAARTAKEGTNLSQLSDMVRKLIPKTHVILTCDTVKYLYRGGHCSKTQAFLGLALRVNPLMIIEKEVLPYGKVIGRVRATDALFKYASKFSNPTSLAVEYYLDADRAKSLIGRLEQKFPGVPIYTSTVGGVVGAHTGPHGLIVSILES